MHAVAGYRTYLGTRPHVPCQPPNQAKNTFPSLNHYSTSPPSPHHRISFLHTRFDPHTRTHTETHTQPHMHTHAHTHTRTHAHTLPPPNCMPRSYPTPKHLVTIYSNRRTRAILAPRFEYQLLRCPTAAPVMYSTTQINSIQTPQA